MKTHIRASVYQLILVVTFFSSTTQAAFVLDRSIVIMDSGSNGREDITVINDSQTEKLYVSVDLYSVASPGQTDQKLQIPDPSSKKEFIASPTKLVIPPGERKLVRLLNLIGPNDKERVYRINFTPIVKPLEVEKIEPNEDGEIIQPGVQIVVAYQVLVIVLPEDSKKQMMVTREGKNATFSNTGNVNILLYNGQQCNPDNKSECSKITGFRLYPGNIKSVELPYDSSLSFSERSYEGVKNVIYD
jgi:Mat/Ecp fimbriae periplasmic chaperone